MRPAFAVLLLIPLLASCGGESPEPVREVITYNVDADRVTVSGLSSGAFMAGQMHVAHSSLFQGAALLAGGPYSCARASITAALGACVSGEGLDTEPLVDFALNAEQSGAIDSMSFLQDDKVWLFHGASDDIVNPAVTDAARVFYEHFGATVTFVTDVPAAHGMPTLDTGAPCDEMLTPFLNDCDYDAAGALLEGLYGPIEDRLAPAGELRVISQPGGTDAEMLAEAFLYVPESCAAGASCGLHVAFHGCRQSARYVGDAFAAGAGYNEWAESNNLLVLYPQVANSRVAPMNPLGCWDWWGYTDDDYATRSGAQVAAVKATMDTIAGREL